MIRRFLIRQIVRFRFLSLLIARKCIYSNNEELTYRLFTKNDSIDELTQLINIAYKPNAEKGMNFIGATQNSATTYKRIRKGICIIVLHENKIIGTITFKAAHKTKGCDWYNKPYVAKRNLLAVAPEFQRQRIAIHLIKLTEIIALEHGAEEVAVDTAENNTTLFSFYNKNQYRYIETIKWKGTNYNSVVYSKKLID